MTKSSGLLLAFFCLLVGCADSGGDAPCVDDTTCSEEEPPEELALQPRAPFFFVNVSSAVSPGDAGTLSVSSSGARCGGGSCSVRPGSQVTLSAIPHTGYSFVRWTGCSNSTSPTILITPRASTRCTATFARRQFTVTAQAGVLGTVVASVGTTVCPSAICTVDLGGSVSMVATPGTGASFVGWSGCAGSPSGAVLTVSNVVSNLTCTANFQRLF